MPAFGWSREAATKPEARYSLYGSTPLIHTEVRAAKLLRMKSFARFARFARSAILESLQGYRGHNNTRTTRRHVSQGGGTGMQGSTCSE